MRGREGGGGGGRWRVMEMQSKRESDITYVYRKAMRHMHMPTFLESSLLVQTLHTCLASCSSDIRSLYTFRISCRNGATGSDESAVVAPACARSGRGGGSAFKTPDRDDVSVTAGGKPCGFSIRVRNLCNESTWRNPRRSTITRQE